MRLIEPGRRAGRKRKAHRLALKIVPVFDGVDGVTSRNIANGGAR